MKDILERIKNKYESLKIEIIFMGLFVLLFLFLNGPGLSREAAALYGAKAHEAAARAVDGPETEQESDSESETESNSEIQDESVTPAELAAAGQGTEDIETEKSGETKEQTKTEAKDRGNTTASGKEIPVLLVKMKQLNQMPVEFHIPMSMPQQEKIVEYHTGLPFCLARTTEEKSEVVEFVAYRSLDLLKRMIENRIAEYDGDWSVYVKNLKTDESFVVNDRPMKSASVMKLFIMGAVYKAVESGALERTDEVVSLMNSMITASDNEASNRLLYLLGDSSYADGIAEVDRFIQEYGFSDMTVEYNGFNNSDTVMDPGRNNQVSAKDCGKLLEDIYRRNWVNRSAANEMEQMMLNQQTRYKIPAGLPEGVSCGNKTGEMDTTENDAAVVYAENCDYILVVLSSDWNSKDQAISRISSMSGMVYEFLN